MNVEPNGIDLKDPNLEFKEESSAPYESPPDVIDVGRVQAGDVQRVMRRYAILSSVAYKLYNSDSNVADAKMKEHLPQHDIDAELSDDYSTVITKEHPNKQNDVIIAYRGTQNFSDLATDIFQVATGSPVEKLLGIKLGHFKLAQDKYDATKLKYPDANITTTGHSLGGTLAHYTGKNNNVKSFIFNAGSSPLDAITNITTTDTPENTSTHYYTTGDIVGASQALLGSNSDDFVPVNSNKWIKDLAQTIGATIGGGVIGGTLAFANMFNDLHGLHNFLPPETFKGTLEPDDILYRWVKPIHDKIKSESRNSTRATQINFDKPQSIKRSDFFKLCLNPFDPKCKIK